MDESCSHCGNMTIAMLRSRYLLARRGGIPLALPRSSSSGRRTTSAQGQGDLRITVRASPSSASPRASHSSSTSHRLGFPDEYAGSSDRAGPSISFGAPADDRLSITASGDELGSGEDDLAALPPSGRVALPESDPELTAMLSRAAESIGLHYRRPPSPERSRLDDWFLRAQAERRQPPPVPFFPEVHEEVTRSWKAPFSARSRPSASSVLTTLDGGAAQGYVEVPPVERAIAMQLCPQGAAAWRGNPRLPSRACKFSSALTAKAYGAAGQGASALHAMALLQVHQAKALKQLHEGDADPGVLQELRTATDLALRATKVTARALGQTMSTLVVQERHLWLTLADMRESDKHRFLDSPISQAGLFGEAVEDFAQQFSAAQKQMEAFRILPRRSAAVSTPPPAAAPPPARRRRRPPAASTSAPARPQQQPSQWPQHGAGRRKAARPASAPAKPVKCQGRRRPWDGRPGASGSCSSGDGDSTTPSPGGGPGGEFLFCSATGPRVSGTQNFIRAVSFFSGSQEGEDGSARDPVSTFPSPSLFASGQQGPVRGRDAFSRAPCPAVEPGECCTTHSDPTSRRSAFRVGPLGSTALPHRGYVYVSPGPACTAPGGLARAPQAVSLAPEDHQTRLRDSVRPASSQVQGQSVHLSVEPGCPCLACRSRGPTGEGRDTAGSSSRDGVRALQRPLLHRSQETRWVTSNLGPACSEPGPCQAPVQDVDAETPLSMRPSLRLGCSDRPERRLLPCLDPPSIPLCVRRASIPVGPPLRAPQPVGASGQPGKEQTLLYAEDLFSRQGVGLGQPHSTSLRGACSVNAEMPGVSPAQEGGSTETFSEAPGAYGILSRYHAARIASYETASALASRPSPEMGMTPRHIPGLTHPVLPSHLQPMVGSCLSSGRSSPRASIQARCCFNRRLCHGLGGHVQRARSHGALDRAPAAVAYQLPRVAGSIACSAPLQNAATREAYTGPFGQHCDRCVHQPPGRSTLPSHVATRPPSPPLESEASEVASRRSCPRRAQSCSRRALTSARPSGRMATPPRGTPAELETLRGRSGRPVCLPGHVSLPVVFLPVRGDPRYRCAGMQLASGLTQICVSPSEPSRTDPVQGQGGRGASPLGGALLAQPDVVSRTDAPRDSPSLANSSEEGSTFSERGHPLAPAPRLVESPRMVLGRDAEVLSGLPPAVVNTIASARALSTRQAYRLKWNLFVDWCSPRREDPRRCPIAVVLSFLQDGLERRLSPSTLKVYVAAIAAHHDAVDGKSLGKHDLVIRFLRGARRLNPPRPHLVPSWDLPSVLSALRGAPFEPLQSVELKFLSLKTVLLSALATVKRVGDLQAFSVDDSCLEFGPADSHVVLRPRPGYVPKVPTMPFRDQVVNLQALPREEADPAIALLCPVRALRIYVDRTQSFRTSDQLFVCFGGQQKGRAVSKQRLAHWIVEAIVLAYQARRLPCPLGVRAHSTRGVASSWALARGASIADICKAAGWATPNTFARFYNLRIEPVSSRVLVSDGQ